MTTPLPIVYRDDFIIAVNKPSGLLVHRSKLDRHDHNNVLRQLREQTGCYLYPLHRLDKPTSGVLLLALEKSCARSISTQFEHHTIEKQYSAVVRGYCDENGTIDYGIRDRDARHKPRLSAVTHYHTLAQIEIAHRIDRYSTTRYSLVQLNPLSGRRHQLRLHMKHIKHPLIGDTSYGKALHNQFFNERYACSRLLLHADHLTLTHPHTQKRIKISAPIDDEQFLRVLEDPLWQQHNTVATGN